MTDNPAMDEAFAFEDAKFFIRKALVLLEYDGLQFQKALTEALEEDVGDKLH